MSVMGSRNFYRTTITENFPHHSSTVWTPFNNQPHGQGDRRSSTVLPRTVYSWIGQRVHFGFMPALLLLLSDFTTKTSFGFFIKNYTRHIFFRLFVKSKKLLARTIFCVLGNFSEKNGWFSDNWDTLAINKNTSRTLFFFYELKKLSEIVRSYY